MHKTATLLTSKCWEGCTNLWYSHVGTKYRKSSAPPWPFVQVFEVEGFVYVHVCTTIFEG